MSEGNSNNEPTNNANETTNVKVADAEVLDRFKELKEGFDAELKKRDKKIEELEKALSEKDKEISDKNKEVDTTITQLNNDVRSKLEEAEEFRNMQENIDKLMDENANIAISNYVKEGKIAPSQVETAKELYLSNREMFDKLYENAPTIVDTSSKPQSRKDNVDINKIAQYFKN